MQQRQTTARWYAVQCKGGESFRAAENLANQGFEIFHPTISLRKKRQGRLQWVTEPLFPYYLFIRLDQASSDWRPIRSTRGVAKLVSFGLQPAQVPNELITTLQQHALSTDVSDQQPPLISPGETVHIDTGPFAGKEAVFNQKNGEKRAMVLIELLNRSHQIEISLADISLRP